METKNPFVDKKDYERLMAQGKKEDMERLFEFEVIKFKETKKRKGNIKVLNEYAKIINPAIKERKKEDLFTRRGQLENFWEEQPFYYDKSKIFWLWNKEETKWDLSNEVDLCNHIQEILGIETIDSKARNELVEGFKQIGRKHKPKDIEKSWVQFKDKIYDIKTGESFESSPEYFSTNPIPWSIGESEETPTMDKLFKEWVGEDYQDTLYEFLAYNISLNKFMQRIFAFCGGGSNGKGTFIKLNYKFLGEENYVSSEIKDLSENRFEAANLYKKLLCVMGEVGHDDLKNTNQLKKLGGEDKISFEFKSKDSFTADNTATCVCLTNSLPITPDKSLGFYRKWLIIDFPNQFKQINENIIDKIPDVEFNNLAKKCLRILKELYENPKFTNEGDFEERTKRYEERSNPILNFVDENYEEIEGSNIILRDFANNCNEYLKKKHLKILTAKQIGRILRNDGFLVGNRKIGEISAVVICNLRPIIKGKLSKLSKLSTSHLAPYRQSSLKHDSNDSNDSFTQEKPESLKELMKKTVIDYEEGDEIEFQKIK